MTRSANKADRDRLRVLEQQDKRRRKEQEKMEANMEWENPLSVEQKLEKVMEEWGKAAANKIYGKKPTDVVVDEVIRYPVTTTVNEGVPVFNWADGTVSPTEQFRPVRKPPKPAVDEWKLIEL